MRSYSSFLPQFVLDWLTCRISSNDSHPAQNSNHITINNSCSLQICVHSKLTAFRYSYSIISNMNKIIHWFLSDLYNLEQKTKAFMSGPIWIDCDQVYSIFTLPYHFFHITWILRTHEAIEIIAVWSSYLTPYDYPLSAPPHSPDHMLWRLLLPLCTCQLQVSVSTGSRLSWASSLQIL